VHVWETEADALAFQTSGPFQRLVATEFPKVMVGPPQREVYAVVFQSDGLDANLAARGIEMIAPHRRNHQHPTQDGRALRRYRRRWKVERLWAWLQNFRRVVVRYEFYPQNFRAFVQLACALILLRQLF
jgi:transposase